MSNHPLPSYAGLTIESGEFADILIAKEVAIQDKMWGVNNDRADATDGQMLGAAMSSLDLVYLKTYGNLPSQTAVKIAKDDFYPKDWDGFRDYAGGAGKKDEIANLVVAAAFIRSEIKRLLIAGQGYERAKREEAYTTASPNMSSEAAGG